MADQSSHDVVNQTLSGGEPSPSDVPESKSAKFSAVGDEVGVDNDTKVMQPQSAETREMDEKKYLSFPSEHPAESDKLVDSVNSIANRTAPGLVANKMLELNGVSSLSDGFEDTGSVGGSESDTSRPDGRYHSRAGSVKKPASFKPVSFAKFSMPKAPGSSVNIKAGEKGTTSSASASPQPTSRPRLVAKSTSGLRDSTSKPSSSGLRVTGSGPDPSQVWNKNRPTQPPPPKHLTDEELKQQYGIHMTSRIQEDGSGTEAKWADIDDDEDDWAPETIEWNDGTKIKLTHTESHPQSQDMKHTQDTAAPSSRESSTTRDSAKALFTKPATTVGPNATILRVGANAERQQQTTKSNNAPAKSANEKPILTSKGPAPPPIKSPWAALPPIDKVSPVNPPIQNKVSSRLPPRESQRIEASQVPNVAALPREIAADDFNRSWRDGQPSAPRELFNSHSGRYEPVLDSTRKVSSRIDGQFRPPSLLQRPTHHEQTGPAEPSAAFQTHRTSNQEGGHWNRRRASSNVSGGSGSIGRRMSLGRPDPPPKFHEGRRGSQSNGILDPAISPTESLFQKPQALSGTSPTQSSNSPVWQPRNVSGMAYAPPGAQSIHVQPPSSVGGIGGTENDDTHLTVEDPVALQQRIMREKLQQARQRRREQEEKEELEKKERIRLKLESLGPLPSEKEKQTPADQTQSSETPETSESPNQLVMMQSPPKPPIPEPSGEPKQYGLMKVHPPEPVRTIVAPGDRPSENVPNGLPNLGPSGQNREPKVDAVSISGILYKNDAVQSPNQEQTEELSKDEVGVQWKGNLSSTSFSPWGAGSKLGAHSTSNANPWKPLSNDKTLGNGTFDRSLVNFSSPDLPLRGHLSLPDLPAIGLPAVNNSDKAVGSQSFTSPSRLSQENQQSVQPLAVSDSRHVPFDTLHPFPRPSQIGPSNMHASNWQSDTRRSAETATSAWQTFANTARQNEAAEEKRQRELNPLHDDASSNSPFNFNETWRQVRASDQASQRQVVSVNRLTENVGSFSHLHGFDATVDVLPFTEHQPRHIGHITGRGSRFFPPVVDASKRVCLAEDARPQSPSPPPPEELSSHPAFSRESQRPLVHLPTPKPVVRLPPKTLPLTPKQASFVSLVTTNPHRVIPPTTVTSWQDRINDLFGKKPASDKRTLLAVTSATKEPLEVQSPLTLAAVSFPQIVDGESREDAGKVTSKEVEDEEMMFEDREAGSLPVVRVPIMAPPAAWHAALPPPARLRSKPLKPMQVHSIELSLESFEKDSSSNVQIVINFPGQETIKKMLMSKKQSQSPRSKSTPTFRPRKNPKPRDTPANLNASQPNSRQTLSTHTKSSNPSRGNFGQNSWGTRIPGVAH